MCKVVLCCARLPFLRAEWDRMQSVANDASWVQLRAKMPTDSAESRTANRCQLRPRRTLASRHHGLSTPTRRTTCVDRSVRIACDESAEYMLQMAPSLGTATGAADFPTPHAFILAPQLRQYNQSAVMVIRLHSAEHDVLHHDLIMASNWVVPAQDVAAVSVRYTLPISQRSL